MIKIIAINESISYNETRKIIQKGENNRIILGIVVVIRFRNNYDGVHFELKVTEQR